MSIKELVCEKCRHPLLDEKVLVSPKSYLSESYHDHEPSPLEKNLLRTTLMDAGAEKLRLDAEIVRATLLLGQWQSQQKRVETYIAEHESVFAPIQHLPVEIMVEIFTSCLLDPHGLKSIDNVRLTLSLSQVNKRWRDIAISTPQLWSRIIIKGFDIKHSPNWLSHLVKTTEIWLERSQRSPLYLYIDLWADCVPFLEALIPHSNRWKRAHLQLSLPMFAALAPVRGHLLSLVSLDISPYMGMSRVAPSYDTYELAPQLRRVRVDRDIVSIALPWSQLTEWNGRGATISDCITILERAPNLSACYFTLLQVSATPPPIHPPLPPHNHLATLDITLSDAHTTSVFLSLLTLPVLRLLCLELEDDRPINEFPSFLSRSPLLDSMHVSMESFPYGALTKILRHAPSIVRLTLTSQHWNTSTPDINDLMDELIYDKSPGALGLVPMLRTLCFNRAYQLSTPPLVDMASSRFDCPENGKPSRLDSLHIVYKLDEEIDPEVPEALKPFEEMGLGVYIDKMIFLDPLDAPDPYIL